MSLKNYALIRSSIMTFANCSSCYKCFDLNDLNEIDTGSDHFKAYCEVCFNKLEENKYESRD